MDEDKSVVEEVDGGKGGLLAVLFEGEGSEYRGIDFPDSTLTEQVIGCAFTVSNTLGAGFIERVYENALAHELRKASLSVVQQQRMNVVYDGVIVGTYDADIVVNNRLIIEVKAVRGLDGAHRAQCLNYLKATGIRLGLMINFGVPRIEIKRLAL